MCLSRLHRVTSTAGSAEAVVESADGTLRRVSLLALDGPVPAVGEWLVVHSGYAIGRAGADEAAAVAGEVRSALEAARKAAPAS